MLQDTDTPIVVSSPAGAHPDSREVEMVERKGRGHPDSICDALAEAFSISLTREYHERCGAVLHHNVDKVLLAAGSSAPRFGGGEVVAPMRYLPGRARNTRGGRHCDFGRRHSASRRAAPGFAPICTPSMLSATSGSTSS